MKLLPLFLFLLVSTITFSQITERQAIADSSFGWMKIHNYKGYKTSRTLGSRVFSATQLSICDSFVNWMQASYIPKGCIGDVRKVIMPEIGLYNKHQQFAPQGYGATSYTWSLYMKDGKPTPIQETEIPWGITANEAPGHVMENLCTNGDYYFYMEEKSPFFENTPRNVMAKYDIKTLPQFAGFYTAHSTASRYDRNANFVEAVLLCKDNKLPFIQVTIGDLLNKADKLILESHQEKLNDIKEKNKGNQKSIDYFSGYENESYQKALATIARHKEKYKSRFSEFAFIPYKFDYIDFVNGQDIFTRAKMDEKTITGELFPVYKYAPGVVEQSKQDKPLWIRVTWYWTLNDERMRHMHESIINNFNFSYLYNFFYAPEKVKGQVYKPLHPPYNKETVVAVEKSSAAKKAAQDNSIHFFEDFSGNNTGTKPAGWYSETNQQGSYSKVVTFTNDREKWLEVKGHSGLVPNNLKKPLPQNFELSFDIAVPKGFTWGAKAFELYLGTEGRYRENGQRVLLRLKPGFDGRAGETSLQGDFGAGYFAGIKSYYDAPGFSNNADINPVHVTLKKQGEALDYFIDGKLIVNVLKAMPAATLFNWLQITHIRSDAGSEKYYISNVKITRL
ncbi:MAG: hypothetical protein U0V75_16030 [Ferruginibacter sp.]